MKQLLVSFILFLQFWCLPAMPQDLRCQIDTPSITERIENRRFPSIFQPWLNIHNLPETIDADERITYHDLMWHAGFGSQYFTLSNVLIDPKNNFYWEKLKTSLMLSLNLNLIFIADLPVKALGSKSWVHQEHLKRADFPWLRDADGNRVGHWIDFTQPEAQEMFAEQAKAYQDCGYDGIFLDFWQEDEDLQRRQAQVAVLKRMRELVGDEFLIIVNTNDHINASSAPYINGLFMETFRALSDNYSHRGMMKLEQTLLWAAANLQEPVVNCLEGEGIGSELPNSPANLQGMRMFTTLSLTHSDGYVLYTMGVQRGEAHEHDASFVGPWGQPHLENHDINTHGHHHAHYWYDFWEADLGQPIGEKGQLYDEGIKGLFIREFTNGWAVYNRSGKEQQIEFSEAVSGVARGVEEKRSHTLPDLDGEIYLKSELELETPPTVDVNSDGVVNIQDLVIVANALGEAEPDLNGDGVVNIQDLVIVANAF